MFEVVDRPKKRSTFESTLFDIELESALRATAWTGKGIVVPLGLFNSSPAKSRLWANGYALKHRRQGDTVVAWMSYVGIQGKHIA